MPTSRHVPEKGRGGGLQLQHKHRVAIFEQHATGKWDFLTAIIVRNIVAVVRAIVSWWDAFEHSIGEVRTFGLELTAVEEAIAAPKSGECIPCAAGGLR